MWNKLHQLANSTRIPKNLVAIYLSFAAVSAVLFSHQDRSVWSIFYAVVGCLTFDYLFLRLRRVEPFLLSAAVVSGLIIGLLSSPSLPWYYFLLAAALAMGSKNFLKANNRHIFNPASFGLFFSSLLFHQNVSWWGAIFQLSLAPIPSLLLLLVLLSPAYVSIIRLRRFNTVASFLLVFTALQLFLRFNTASPTAILASVFLSPLIIFFAVVMLPEPMTSPNNHRLQLFFGSFVAVIAVAANYFHFFIPDAMILSLLTANLVFFKLRQIYP